MTEHAVVIAGGGPTGLTLAGELALAGGVHFDLGGFPTRHPYSLGLRQNHIERILAGWVDELEVPIYRAIEVTGHAVGASGSWAGHRAHRRVDSA